MEYDQQLFGDFELFRVFALLGDITPTFSRNNCSELFRVFVTVFFIGNKSTLFAATSLYFILFSRPFCQFLNLRIIPPNPAKSRNNSNYAEILCASNTENRRTVSRILAASEEANLDGAGWSKISPGSAPRSATPPVTLSVPSSGTPLPLPLRTTPSPSPQTLARNPHPAPGASAFAPKPARTLPFPAHSEPKRIAHPGTGFSSRRPVPGP